MGWLGWEGFEGGKGERDHLWEGGGIYLVGGKDFGGGSSERKKERFFGVRWILLLLYHDFDLRPRKSKSWEL